MKYFLAIILRSLLFDYFGYSASNIYYVWIILLFLIIIIKKIRLRNVETDKFIKIEHRRHDDLINILKKIFLSLMVFFYCYIMVLLTTWLQFTSFILLIISLLLLNDSFRKVKYIWIILVCLVLYLYPFLTSDVNDDWSYWMGIFIYFYLLLLLVVITLLSAPVYQVLNKSTN